MVVLALLHIRTKLFETIRLSIYDTAKLDNDDATLTRQKLNSEIKFQSLRRNNRISCQPSDYGELFLINFKYILTDIC